MADDVATETLTSAAGASATTILGLVDSYVWSVAVIAFAVVLLWRGMSIVGAQIKEKGIGPANLQALGLVVLLPSILILSTNSEVPGELPATLIGAIAGYVFGVRNAQDKG